MERLNLSRKHNKYDPCECAGCRGMLTVDTSIPNVSEKIRTQYICCNVCRWAPEDNKIIVPLEFSPPRSR